MNLIETYNGSGLYAQYATSADYASNGQPLSAALTAIPDTYLQNTDLEISDNKITGISGVPLAAGGSEIPTAVSGYWQSASDTVCANSGVWGGSALPISAGPGIKFEMVNDTLVASTDETVLFNGDLTANASATLSESWLNFERIKVFGYSQPGGSMNAEAQVSDISGNYTDSTLVADINLATVASWVHRDNFNIIASMPIVFINNTTISAMNGRLMGYWNGEWQTSFNEQRGHCTKVIGINRIAGEN